MLGLALAACSAPPAPRPRGPSSADDAVELAALLPDTLERCVVVRPGAVPDRRRSLVLPHSLAEPFAWAPDLHPIAYATAVAEREDGRQARRSYYRFAHPADDEVRATLNVRWLDEPCEGEACRVPVARWIDELTLEVARYEWPRRELPVSSAECVQLARSRPDAIEVAADVTSHVGMLRLGQVVASRSVMRAARGALVSERVLVFGDEVEARIVQARLAVRDSWTDPALIDASPSRHRIDREGARVIVGESRRWEELELALEDQRLSERALSLAHTRGEPTPLARVRVEDLGVVRTQVRLRRAALSRMPPEARPAAARELAALLARAWEAHPSELGLARSLVRLSLDVLDDADGALAVVEQVLARGLDARPVEWRALRREVLSHVSAEALADALIADRVAPPAEVPRAAADLRALHALGVPYEWSEGAWRTSRELFEARPPRASVDARVPFEGVLGALVGWARIQDPSRRPTVQVAVRARGSGEVRAIGDTRPEVVAVRSADGGMVYVGALASPDLIALRRLGASLASAIGAGPLEIVLALRDPNAEEVSRFSLSGTVAGGVLVVERASASLADAPWPLLTRYLANPLAELPTALFPPPTLTVRTESAELAAELRQRVDEAAADACRAAGPIVRCRRPGRPDELGELLLRIASERARGELRSAP